MPELFTPAEIFRGKPANFRIRLVPPDPEGVYQFRFAPRSDRYGDGDVGFVQEIITRVMRRGSVDADLEVRFNAVGERLLQYHFAADRDQILRPDDEEEAEGDTAQAGSPPRRAPLAPGRPARPGRPHRRAHGRLARRPATRTSGSRSPPSRSARPRCPHGWTAPSRSRSRRPRPAPTRSCGSSSVASRNGCGSPSSTSSSSRGCRVLAGSSRTNTGAYELLQRLSKRFLQLAADPQRAVVDPRDPSVRRDLPDHRRSGRAALVRQRRGPRPVPAVPRLRRRAHGPVQTIPG